MTAVVCGPLSKTHDGDHHCSSGQGTIGVELKQTLASQKLLQWDKLGLYQLLPLQAASQKPSAVTLSQTLLQSLGIWIPIDKAAKF